MHFGALGLVAVENAVDIEVEKLGIGPNKADRIGRARQILRAALFERGGIDGLMRSASPIASRS